jgi:hypothetical protein
MTVCNTRHLGFPPPDVAARNFLTMFDKTDEEIEDTSYKRAWHFLRSLFLHTTKTISELGGDESTDRIQRFRQYMSEGQTFDSAGDKRKKFYLEVVRQATEATEVRRILVINFHPYK